MAQTRYAPRCKTWPPAGYAAPTEEEFAALLRAVRRYADGQMFQGHWKRLSDETIVRHLQLTEVLPDRYARGRKDVWDYAHAVRREMSRRKLAHQSIRILRCPVCTHATERLFEATQATHPGLENYADELIESAWFCARCWSRYGVDEWE